MIKLMQRSLAFLFAVIGTVFLIAIAFFVSARQPWMVLLSILLTLGFFGFSFATKARLRRKQESEK
jgi:fatty acid desaturase